MNKAFCKDPDPGEPRCPTPRGCGAIGILVSAKTLQSQLPEDTARGFADAAYYCPNAHCDIAYFDTWGTTAPRSALKNQAYPKTPTAPVCSCFGGTAAQIQKEAEAGSKDLVRELLKKAESDEARCETESPCGTSCVAEIRRLFLKHFLSD